jgi:hypothetical protein
LSCGVLSRCHIVARLKSKDFLFVYAEAMRQNDITTTRRRTTTRRLACFSRDRTTRRQCGNEPLGGFARDKTKRR